MSKALKDRASNARKKKQIGDDARKHQLEGVIQEVAKSRKLTLAASEKFAATIIEDVCAKLNVDPDASWPSLSTIKASISDIKRRARLQGLSSRRAILKELP